MPKRLFKIVLVAVILSAATAVWIPRQRSLAEARVALAETKQRQLQVEERITAATTELESARSELRDEKATHKQTRSALAKAEAELTKTDPESLWTTPPDNLPDWNSQSPYVWVRKDILPGLPINAFYDSGALNTEVASVLTLDTQQTATLNATLTNLLADYHALETAKAEKSDEHLPGIAGQDGKKLTIVVHPQPEDGKRYMQQFETTLRNEIGAQRADLVLRVSDTWLDQQFSQSGAEPKTISLLRHPDGSYSVSVKSGNNWLSTGGPWQIAQRYIPAHLRPMFNELAPPQPQQASE